MTPFLQLLLVLLALILVPLPFVTGDASCNPGQAAVVSRAPGYVDVFFGGAIGRVYTSSRGPGDTSFSALTALGDVQVMPCSNVTAIANSDGSISVFVSGIDGYLYQTDSDTDGSSFSEWAKIHNSGFQVPPGDEIIPASKSPGDLELFVVGLDNELYFSNKTSSWFAISGPNISPGDSATVFVRSSEVIDVFVTDNSGHVYDQLFNDQDSLTLTSPNWIYAVNGDTTTPRTPLSLLLVGDKLHFFTLSPENRIWTAVRTDLSITSNDDAEWTTIGSLAVLSGTSILPISPAPSFNSIQLFLTDSTGTIYTTNSSDSTTYAPWTVISGVKTMPGAPLSGIAGINGSITLFVISMDNNLSTIDWNSTHNQSCKWWHVGDNPIDCAGALEPNTSSASTPTSSSAPQSPPSSRVGIGVGVGLGVPLGLSLVGGIAFLVWRLSKGKMWGTKNAADLGSTPIRTVGQQQQQEEQPQIPLVEAPGNFSHPGYHELHVK